MSPERFFDREYARLEADPLDDPADEWDHDYEASRDQTLEETA